MGVQGRWKVGVHLDPAILSEWTWDRPVYTWGPHVGILVRTMEYVRIYISKGASF